MLRRINNVSEKLSRRYNFTWKNWPVRRRGGEGREGGGVKMLHTYIHIYIQTDIQTEPLTKRVLEEHSLLIMYECPFVHW